MIQCPEHGDNYVSYNGTLESSVGTKTSCVICLYPGCNRILDQQPLTEQKSPATVPIEGPDNLSLLLDASVPAGTAEVSRAAGGCPRHGRLYLRLGLKGQGRGRPSKRVFICTFATMSHSAICGEVKEVGA